MCLLPHATSLIFCWKDLLHLVANLDCAYKSNRAWYKTEKVGMNGVIHSFRFVILRLVTYESTIMEGALTPIKICAVHVCMGPLTIGQLLILRI